VVLVTDDAGNPVEEAWYPPFGAAPPVELPTERGYTGQRFDIVPELYYYGARWYDPATDRFLSKDPNPGSIYQPQTLNLYVYVLNNPVNDRDPSGEQGENAFEDFLAVAEWAGVGVPVDGGVVVVGATAE